MDNGLTKLAIKVKQLERQHDGLKKTKKELDERLLSDEKTGKKAAYTLTKEELTRVNEQLTSKHSELKIARYEAKNVNMLLEESKADLVRLIG